MWTYHEPAKLIFGVGAAENLNSEMEALGVTKAVLLSSKSMFRQGIPQQLAELTGGKIVAISTEVEPDPTVENVDHAAALARQNGADCVIGLGGGSVIDCAKATAAAVAEDLTAAELVRKKEVRDALPIIAIPTTAGTGSEVTRVAVISDKSAGLKLAVYSQALFPKLALVDPQYTASVPKRTTAATGLDALAHALDALSSRKPSPVTNALAQKACELIVKNLEAVLEDGNNLDARAGMSQASTIAGLAFSQTGTTGSHACSYRLSIEHHIPHGEACAFTLDRWVEINAEARPELRQIYQAIGFENEAAFAAWINRMKAKGELRTTLRECGVTDRAEIAAFADHALKNNNYANNVAQIGYEGLYKLFEEKF